MRTKQTNKMERVHILLKGKHNIKSFVLESKTNFVHRNRKLRDYHAQLLRLMIYTNIKLRKYLSFVRYILGNLFIQFVTNAHLEIKTFKMLFHC